MPDRMERIIKNVAEAFSCNYEFSYTFGVPMTINHPEVIKQLSDAAVQALGSDYATKLPEPVMGSEDFSLYTEVVPHGAILRLGTSDPGAVQIPLHNDKYNFNDDAIPYGMALLTQFVLNAHK